MIPVFKLKISTLNIEFDIKQIINNCNNLYELSHSHDVSAGGVENFLDLFNQILFHFVKL